MLQLSFVEIAINANSTKSLNLNYHGKIYANRKRRHAKASKDDR
jgi:hypothetical protein